MSAAEATRNGTPRRSSAKTARCSLRDHDAKGLGFDAGDEDAPLDGDASRDASPGSAGDGSAIEEDSSSSSS